jgi:hypothetical protein
MSLIWSTTCNANGPAGLPGGGTVNDEGVGSTSAVSWRLRQKGGTVMRRSESAAASFAVPANTGIRRIGCAKISGSAPAWDRDDTVVSTIARPHQARRARAQSLTHQVARVGAIAALVAVMASMFWPWTTRGTGSAIPGHRLASLILEGRTDFVIARPFGAVLFLVPALAATALAMLTIRGRAARYVRLGAVIAAGAISMTLLALLHRLSFGGMGAGGWLACVGSVAAAVCLTVSATEA